MKPLTVFRKLTPPILVDAAKAIRRSLCRPIGSSTSPSPRHSSHARLNSQGNSRFVFRDGLAFAIHPESVVPFEHFCYRDDVMSTEMDEFLSLTTNACALLDIGALHGVFTLPFAVRNPASRVLAVDASPLAFPYLLYNVNRNHLSHVTPVECAVSDSDGTLTMHLEWHHAIAAASIDASPDAVVQVPKTTGDALCKNHALAPDVVKIDVEGHEVKVLRGLAHTLAVSRPTVFLEVHPDRIAAEGDNVADIVAQFSPLQYTAKRIGGSRLPLEAIARFSTDERVVLEPIH